ncbi:hypothetical protein P3T23_000685 [Paraburkholderia sp. GAS448]
MQLTTLACRLCKLLLLFALFLLSVRYVHTYPSSMTLEQQQLLIEISDKLGVTDYELLYIGAVITIDLIVAIVLYVMIMKIWRRCRSKSRRALEH